MTEKEIYVTPEMKIWTFEKITMSGNWSSPTVEPDPFEDSESGFSETDNFE